MTAWLLLLLDDGASYGYDLRRELDTHQLDIDPSILYRTLRRLERDGWVQSRWMKPQAGPRRRFYRLTARGRRALDDMAVLIVATRDMHDSFLRVHELALAQRRSAGKRGTRGTRDDGDASGAPRPESQSA